MIHVPYRGGPAAVALLSGAVSMMQRAQPGEPWVVSPEELSARIKTDYEKYGKLIRSIGVKVE